MPTALKKDITPRPRAVALGYQRASLRDSGRAIAMPESICYRVRPRVVLAWLEKEFPFNSTRWEFEPDHSTSIRIAP